MDNFIFPSDADRAENEDLDRVCQYAEELIDERDAALEREAGLAAHVDTLTNALTLSKDRIELITGIAVDRGASVYAAIDIWPGEMQRVIDQSPTTSLTKRDLLQRAEELEEVAAQIGLLKPNQVSPVGLSIGLKLRAKDKRQQAKEQPND